MRGDTFRHGYLPELPLSLPSTRLFPPILSTITHLSLSLSPFMSPNPPTTTHSRHSTKWCFGKRRACRILPPLSGDAGNCRSIARRHGRNSNVIPPPPPGRRPPGPRRYTRSQRAGASCRCRGVGGWGQARSDWQPGPSSRGGSRPPCAWLPLRSASGLCSQARGGPWGDKGQEKQAGVGQEAVVGLGLSCPGTPTGDRPWRSQ